MSQHQPANFWRSLQAKLWILAQPSVWGTAIFLLVLGLIIREYWQNPGFLFSQPETTEKKTQATDKTNATDKNLSEEEKAIAADIDNLSILKFDSEQAELENTTNKPSEKAKKQDDSQTLLDEAKKQQATSTTEAPRITDNSSLKSNNPFVSEAENLLKMNSYSGSNKFSGFNAFNPNSSSSTTTSAKSDNSNFDFLGRTNSTESRSSIPNLSPNNSYSTNFSNSTNPYSSNFNNLNNPYSTNFNNQTTSRNSSIINQAQQSNFNTSNNPQVSNSANSTYNSPTSTNNYNQPVNNPNYTSTSPSNPYLPQPTNLNTTPQTTPPNTQSTIPSTYPATSTPINP